MDATGKIKLCIAGPIWTKDLILKANNFPKGSYGAPYLSELVKEFAKNKKYNVSVVTLSNDINKIKFIKYKNINIIYCPLRKHSIRFNGIKLGRSLDFFYHEVKNLIKAYKKINPDIILSNWAYEYSYASYKSNYKFITVNHDIPFIVLKYIPNFYRLVRFLLALIVLKNSKYIITPSEYAKEETKKYTKSKVKVIENIVGKKIKKKNINKVKKISKILMINNGFTKRKNVKIAISSFMKLKKDYPKISLHLYGNQMEKNGKCFNWVMKKYNNYKGIFFYGAINSNKLIKKIRNYDIFLSTSKEETFGVTLVESISAGVPTIAGNNSGAPKFILGSCAQLVDINEIDQIIHAIKKYIDNLSYWKKMAFKSINHSKKFQTSNVFKKYEIFIQKITNES